MLRKEGLAERSVSFSGAGLAARHRSRSHQAVPTLARLGGELGVCPCLDVPRRKAGGMQTLYCKRTGYRQKPSAFRSALHRRTCYLRDFFALPLSRHTNKEYKSPTTVWRQMQKVHTRVPKNRQVKESACMRSHMRGVCVK